tara:strand:- start:33 stop:584 length:552 start_codon:yes stop_codon:yes gene_type:complete
MIHKTFTKKDILDICHAYDIPIEDPKQYNKSELSIALTDILVQEDYQISFCSDYPDFFKNDDLVEYLSVAKSNEELNYKDKSNMIQKAKKIINYARNGYMLSFTDYLSHDMIYQDGIIVSNHCDIPTCRRAIDELNKDPKVRNKIEKQITPKIKKKLEQKKINKQELDPRFKFRRGHYEISFD